MRRVADCCEAEYEEDFNNRSLKVGIYTKIDTKVREKLEKQWEKHQRKGEAYESTKKAKDQREKLSIKVL